MVDIASLLRNGAGNVWLFIPSAIFLGALHGLEPGHSKTMMAAFIVAVRGTVSQAVLLGVSATLSHTAVVWLVVLAGMYLGSQWSAESSEPYFQIASGVFIIGVALWMAWRIWRQAHGAHGHHDHTHHHHHHDAHADEHGLEVAGDGYQDDHERAHAADIKRRFAIRDVTTGQIILFGLTGGLIPCPAAITVLLLCLQLKKISLGASLVLCFSIGLALTMVISGVVAALSVRHVGKHWSGFGAFARKAPYFSSTVIIVVGLYVLHSGWRALV